MILLPVKSAEVFQKSLWIKEITELMIDFTVSKIKVDKTIGKEKET